jgi:hypothetical protein
MKSVKCRCGKVLINARGEQVRDGYYVGAGRALCKKCAEKFLQKRGEQA